ncbi:MAG: two-component system response regulator [Syntrophus sp. (in: bacteria)]|nr:two-component system response regulator [Syntrophus sp. (in: bacteria)]
MENLRKMILCVDDDPINLDLLEAFLRLKDYIILKAQSGEDALEMMNAQAVDLVLLDVMMPGIDGFEVCRIIKDNPVLNHIPVVMITALADKQSRLRGLKAGANDFLGKPVDSSELLVRVQNLLRIKEFDDFLKDHNKILTIQVAEKTQELRESFIDSVYRLTRAAEHRDDDTACHIQRTGHYVRFLAREIGCASEDVDTFFYASPMHDIGKIGIPDTILLKQAPLTKEEFDIMKTHTAVGARILSGGRYPIMQAAERFACHHHERWDGTGYPAGLKEVEIPLEGRIFNIVDVYDALRSRRPYKPPFTHERAFSIIVEGDGRTMPGHFDPRILEAFKDNHRRFDELYEECGNHKETPGDQ